MHQPPRLVLPAGFEQAHGQQTGRLQADEDGHLDLGRSFPGLGEYGDGLLAPVQSGQHGTKRYPCHDVSLQGRIGLHARRPLGKGQHQGWIGPHHRVECSPEHGSGRSDAAPSLVGRVRVAHFRFRDV
jgi:hypothetical protein